MSHRTLGSSASAARANGWIAALLGTTLIALASAASAAPDATKGVAAHQPVAAEAARDPHAGHGAAIAPPEGLADLGTWLGYKVRARRQALPLEARVFYRQGLLAKQSGRFEDAVRLVRGAAELDPTFAAPHGTLCSWFLFRDPGQALFHAAGLVELAKQSFTVQLELAANGAFFAFDALLWALIAAGFLVVALRNQEIRHPIQESLTGFLNARAAARWPWVLLAVPFLVGLGLALPTLFFLAFLWPTFKGRERVLFTALAALLVGMPGVDALFGRAAAPLREDAAPFYGALALHNAPATPELRARIEERIAKHPDQPILHFGLGWLHRGGDDLVGAERAYRRALALWPENDRVKNNLANVVALRGRTEEALGLYQEAIAANPKNAAAYFNLSQIHTRRFEFQQATVALSHASALDFEMVKAHQSRTSVDGVLALEDQWMAPRDLWAALFAAPATGPRALPQQWRGRIEFAGGGFTAAAVVAMVAGLMLGGAAHRACPLRRCSNCERVVCRRCAQRRRELALCRTCATVEARAPQPEFARVLLQEHRRTHGRFARIARTTLAALIPGYGLLAFRRIGAPFVMLLATTSLLIALANLAPPFPYEPRLAPLGAGPPVVALLGPWALFYAWSLFAYFAEQARHEARLAAAAQPRVRASKHRVSEAA